MSSTGHNRNHKASRATQRTSSNGRTPIQQYDPEVGDPMYNGAEGPAMFKPRRSYGVGFTERKLRVAEWKYLKRRELKAANPKLTAEQLEKAAEDAYEEYRRDAHGPEAARIFEETSPVSRSRRPSETLADVEMAAMRWLGNVRWLRDLFKKKTNARGFAAEKTLPLAIFLQMALGRERPELATAYDSFTAENRPLRAWAHDYPSTERKRPTIYQSVKKMLEDQDEPEVVTAINVELIRRLAELHNKTEWPRKGRRRKGEPLLVGEVAIVDGTMIPAPVQQRHPLDDEHKNLLHGLGREKVSSIVHKDKDGTPHKKNVGYLMVSLVDMASTLPYGAVVMPAGGNERKAIAKLLKVIFDVWPDCPMNTIVGDGLFQNDKALAHELVFNWGIQPVFPTTEKGFSKALAHAETDGVPKCACGELMKLRDTSDYYTAEKRAKDGIPRGAPAPNLKARIRWGCSLGKGGCGTKIETRPVDEPRLYTFYPRQGNHVRAIERKVFLLRRNAVESVFASLKNLALGTDKFNCPRWATDRPMEWLLSVGTLGLVARRLIHECGLYELAYREAEGLGLLTPATKSNPAPGPDELSVRRAQRDREEHLEPAAAPRGYKHLLQGAGEVAGADSGAMAA